MSNDVKMVGGCMCGAVRYETTGKSFGVVHCHCHSCRKHNGAPVVTLAGYKQEQVKFTGDERSFYQSSQDAVRAYCGNCGTPLTWEGDGGELGPIVGLMLLTTFRVTKASPNSVLCCAMVRLAMICLQIKQPRRAATWPIAEKNSAKI